MAVYKVLIKLDNQIACVYELRKFQDVQRSKHKNT